MLPLFLLLLCFLSPSLSQPQPFTLIDCGTTAPALIEGRQWLPDTTFTSSGTPRTLTEPTLFSVLSTVRSFSLTDNNLHHRNKFCYIVPVLRGAQYMLRSTYFYGGGVNYGYPSPPVFDQIVDGTFWSLVNTTEDYSQGRFSLYEGVFLAQGKTLSFCLGANSHTDSDPFISALEFIRLPGSVYNSSDFGNYALSLIARHSFGYRGDVIRYPDDEFDRYWEPFAESYSTKSNNTEIEISGFWNLPPRKVFETELTTPLSQPMELQWPPGFVDNATYYIALYFAEDRGGGGSRRVLNVTINEVPYYSNLTVSSVGVVVFASQWPLGGLTRVKVMATEDSELGPLINAGEVFELVKLGRRTLTRDVAALEKVKRSFKNPPLDWSGDPCLPRQYSWTGVSCTEGRRVRVVSLNLTGMDLDGSLSPNLANLTALTMISLGHNVLSGPIPNLSSLRNLQILHLNDNHLTGQIPPSLGSIRGLRQLFLQNNNLTGLVPNSLLGKSELDLKVYGNRLSSPPPS